MVQQFQKSALLTAHLRKCCEQNAAFISGFTDVISLLKYVLKLLVLCFVGNCFVFTHMHSSEAITRPSMFLSKKSLAREVCFSFIYESLLCYENTMAIYGIQSKVIFRYGTYIYCTDRSFSVVV